MNAATCTVEQQVRYPGIQVTTESGKAAKVFTDDEPIQITTVSGDAVGSVENVTEYTDESGRVGTQFDVVMKSSTPGASELQLTADADGDAGEVRHITLGFSLAVSDVEAGAFKMPDAVIENAA